MNTKQGGDKLRQTMINKYGSEESWKEHLKEILTKGRNNRKPENIGFAKNKELARRVGSIGGKAKREPR